MADTKPCIEELKANGEQDDVNYYGLGTEYYIKGQYEEAIQCFKRVIEDITSTEEDIHGAAYFIGHCYKMRGSEERSLSDCKNAIEWFEKAVELGNRLSAFDLGQIHEKGINHYDPDTHEIDSVVFRGMDYQSVQWYHVAAEMDHPGGMQKCAEIYRAGKYVTRSYEKAFGWMLKAACHEQKFCPEISSYFKNGIGIEEVNDYEAYVWAIMSGGYFPENELMKLEAKLTRKEVLKAQREADKRIKISGYFIRSRMALYDYMTNLLKKQQQKSATREEQGKPSIHGVAEVPVKEHENADTPNPEPSPGIVYKYLPACKKGFNPELVTLELVLPRKLRKTETLDFTRLKISYDGRDTDAKNFTALIPFRVNKAERRLLVILAAQSSIADSEKRAESVRNILADHKNKERVSHLNAMFRAIFPGCANSRAERMISRQTGYVAPKLVIDTTKIVHARDYTLCGL